MTIASPATLMIPGWNGSGPDHWQTRWEQDLPFCSLVVASTNDPYCTITHARDLAQSWGSEFADVGDAGHINAASGNGPWPEGQRLLQRIIATTRGRSVGASDV